MKEFIETVYNYPWTSLFIILGLGYIGSNFSNKKINQNKMKQVLIFLSVFLFIQICEIYIMGGFDHQTIGSKFISISFGMIVSAFVILSLTDKP